MEASRKTAGADSVFTQPEVITSFRKDAQAAPEGLTVASAGTTLKVTNNRDTTLRNVTVYYKVRHSDGNYFGGITYMAAFGDLEPGQSAEKLAGHFKEGITDIVRIGYQEADRSLCLSKGPETKISFKAGNCPTKAASGFFVLKFTPDLEKHHRRCIPSSDRLRSGRAYCILLRLRDHSQPDPWGAPLCLRGKRCDPRRSPGKGLCCRLSELRKRIGAEGKLLQNDAHDRVQIPGHCGLLPKRRVSFRGQKGVCTMAVIPIPNTAPLSYRCLKNSKGSVSITWVEPKETNNPNQIFPEGEYLIRIIFV